ncbi:hypothetical protein C943_04220 [Mariniradius saccharolyticus AK6]|uniref:Uncharacterized protein n=1 Tax=Mariniradius saccharolyticus AK6 TaxID=1239962 RepID=M7Y9R5_9BACT|nr:hypothetical protein C943_04220 [Mariniradius saccharolyticus AK6]
MVNRHPEVPIAIVEKGLLNLGDASPVRLSGSASYGSA